MCIPRLISILSKSIDPKQSKDCIEMLITIISRQNYDLSYSSSLPSESEFAIPNPFGFANIIEKKIMTFHESNIIFTYGMDLLYLIYGLF